MGTFGKMHTTKSGFTIVELLVVIVVIGILVSISLILWPGYQQRARDSQRKSDVAQVSAALSAYVLQKNNYMVNGSGCGASGNGNGWFNAGPSDAGAGAYPKSILTCLQEAKVISSSGFIDPLQCAWSSGGKCGTYRGSPAQAYMKATCNKNGTPVTYVMAHIEADPRKDSTIDALCDSGSLSGFDATAQLWGTNYGMNYYAVVK